MKDDEYYNQAKDWHYDKYEYKSLERNRFFILLVLVSLIAAGAVFSVGQLVPLKEKIPYMVQNNSATGEVSVVKEMSGGEFIASAKNVEKHVADYLRYRLTFDHHNIDEYFQYVQLMSNGDVGNEYVEYMKNDPRSPYKSFEDKEHNDIYIIDMNHLNDTSVLAHVDITNYRNNAKPKRTRWAVVIDFEWKGIPTDNQYRYFNPAGFTVTRYRKDQMLIESGVPQQ